MSLEEDRQDLHRKGEVVKFLILVAVMLLAVLAVAAARPLIFEQIVPAVLGWQTEEAEMELPARSPATASPTASPPAESTLPAVELEPVSGSPTARPLPTQTPQLYQVEPGDNLSAIANRYGVSVQAITEANNLADPNQIMPGDQLVIP